MTWYPWLNTIYNQILNSYCKNRGHHALILNSKWDNGEDVLINIIARWLICINPDEIQYCNTCYNCRLMNTKQHPDYYQLDLEKNTQSIGIDIIRICIDSIHKSARHSKVKVIFIKYVEYLTHQAMNVLLKTLEEPPANTYFFLKTREYMRIPVTLLSRCVQWSITPPVESLGLEWLMKKQKIIDMLSVQTALRLCNGSPIEANSILQSDTWKQRLKFCKIINHVIVNGNFLKLISSLNANRYDNKPMYWLITLLVDALKWQQKVKEKFIINLDQLQLITVISMRWNVPSLNNQLKQWLILFHYLQKFDNINRELLLTYRLLNWKQDIVETCLQSWSI